MTGFSYRHIREGARPVNQVRTHAPSMPGSPGVWARLGVEQTASMLHAFMCRLPASQALPAEAVFPRMPGCGDGRVRHLRRSVRQRTCNCSG